MPPRNPAAWTNLMTAMLDKLHIPSCSEEAIRALCYDGLRYRDQQDVDSLPVYQRMVNIAFHYGITSVLGLGAGLSTALWARYAHRTGAAVVVVDNDFAQMQSSIESSELGRLIDKHITKITGTVVSGSKTRDFYLAEHPTFGGVAASDILQKLDGFHRATTGESMTRAGFESMKMRDLFSDGKNLRFAPKLLDQSSETAGFESDIARLDQLPPAAIDANRIWELICFDSGEYSSCIEWLMLKDRIPVGGLAAFHDIFFPASIKNVIPCAAILADPNWRVVWLDRSTAQGLLIAQRLN
jgi:hypothetical protein